MSRSHPTDGELRAYLDRELRWDRALAVRWHARGCSRCRAAAAALEETARRAARLLLAADHPAAMPAPARRGTSRGPVTARRVASAAAMVTGLVLGVAYFGGGDGGATTARDVCCWDLDGGGPGDDGVLTFSAPNEVVSCVVLYDDRDGSRSFTPTDHVRFTSRGRACPASLPQS